MARVRVMGRPWSSAGKRRASLLFPCVSLSDERSRLLAERVTAYVLVRDASPRHPTTRDGLRSFHVDSRERRRPLFPPKFFLSDASPRIRPRARALLLA